MAVTGSGGTPPPLPILSEDTVHAVGSARPEGLVATVTVARPEKLNVIGTVEIAAMTRIFRSLSEAPDLRAVILTGAGDRAFIGGADIADMAVLTPETAGRFISLLHGLCDAVRDCPAPVIARIRGYCLGGGLEVAAACDMRAASDDARFGMPEVNVGIPSVIDGALLPRLIGLGKASELVLTGRTIDAEEARQSGLVERLAAADRLDSVIADWLDHILAADQAAIMRQKAVIRDWVSLPYEEAVRRSIDHYVASYRGSGPRDRMTGFLNRKKGG